MNKEKMLCNCNWTIGTCTSPSETINKWLLSNISALQSLSNQIVRRLLKMSSKSGVD